MSDLETGQIVEEVRQLPAVQTHAVNLFGDSNPVAVIQRATEVAQALAAVIEQQELFTVINKRKHVRVEGWTLLGSMLGVFPIVEWTRPLGNGWEARVEARTRSGEIVGAAEAQCMKSEKLWGSRDEYALRSMAQTRAVSKALRHPLGFIMTLAGYEETPEAEMPRDVEDQPAAASGGAPESDEPKPSSQTDKPRAFDPAKDLLENAIQGSGKDQVAMVESKLRVCNDLVDWKATIGAATKAHFGKEKFAQLTQEEKDEWWVRLRNAVAKLEEIATGELGASPDDARQAFAFGFSLKKSDVEVTMLPKQEEISEKKDGS